jgi:thiamine pyrophosphate-dependent acetolactate synthase large subunit-like protein
MVNPKAKLVQVDIQPEEVGRNRPIHPGSMALAMIGGVDVRR